MRIRVAIESDWPALKIHAPERVNPNRPPLVEDAGAAKAGSGFGRIRFSTPIPAERPSLDRRLVRAADLREQKGFDVFEQESAPPHRSV